MAAASEVRLLAARFLRPFRQSLLFKARRNFSSEVNAEVDEFKFEVLTGEQEGVLMCTVLNVAIACCEYCDVKIINPP